MKIYTIILALSLTLFASLAIAQEVTVTFGKGESWVGKIGSKLTVKYENRKGVQVIEGELTKVTDDWIDIGDELIWIDEIISITPYGNEVKDDADGSKDQDETKTTKVPKATTPIMKKLDSSEPLPNPGNLPVGFFILPMEGSVGPYMRPTELKQLVAYIDELYGPGQIIVLKINSGGGSGWTWSDIRDLIFEVRERHRIVAWAEHAISAAAMTAYCCDEIYYTSMGEVGSCSGYRGSADNPLSDDEQQVMINEMEKVMASSNRDPRITGCLFLQNKLLSYSKDPETNEITYFDTLDGDEVLSGYGDNLTLTAQQSVDCGIGDGIADTVEQLAELLNLENGYEIDDYGKKLYDDWKETADEFIKEAGPRLLREFAGDVDANSEIDALRKRIKAGRELIRWADKLGESAMYLNIGNFALTQEGVNVLERQILELDHEIDLLRE